MWSESTGSEVIGLFLDLLFIKHYYIEYSSWCSKESTIINFILPMEKLVWWNEVSCSRSNGQPMIWSEVCQKTGKNTLPKSYIWSLKRIRFSPFSKIGLLFVFHARGSNTNLHFLLFPEIRKWAPKDLAVLMLKSTLWTKAMAQLRTSNWDDTKSK